MKSLSEMKIAMASDHAGYTLKLQLNAWLAAQGADVHDFGCYSSESCDYPDYAHPCAAAVENAEADFGVILCGTGNGISMTANKHQGVRAALCWDVPLAELARQHNNANILALPARFISEELALKITDAFFHTDFEGGRHERRVQKIALR